MHVWHKYGFLSICVLTSLTKFGFIMKIPHIQSTRTYPLCVTLCADLYLICTWKFYHTDHNRTATPLYAMCYVYHDCLYKLTTGHKQNTSNFSHLCASSCVNSTFAHSTLLVFWRHSNVAVWAAIITLFSYTRHYATANNDKCCVSTTISWRLKPLFHKWLIFLTVSVLRHHTISDVCPKWSHFPPPTTRYTKSFVWHTETS